MTELKVCYNGKVDRELDLAIEKALGKLGYERWASGYSADNVRDLAFDKTREEETTLSASEALFGFAGWLTSRPERTVMSSKDDAACVADLVGEFCDVNNIEVLVLRKGGRV